MIEHWRIGCTDGAIDVADFWFELSEGRWILLDHFCTNTRCYGVFRANEASQREDRHLPPKAAEILRRTLNGESQKRIAIELAISEAAVALRLSACRRRLNLNCRTSQMPLLIVLAVQSSFRGALRPLARTRRGRVGQTDFQLVSLPRPDLALGPPLTMAEIDVVRLFLEGHTPEVIAQSRRSRPRTVVNQLSSIRRKLSATGRFELLSALRTYPPPAPGPLSDEIVRPMLARCAGGNRVGY